MENNEKSKKLEKEEIVPVPEKVEKTKQSKETSEKKGDVSKAETTTNKSSKTAETKKATTAGKKKSGAGWIVGILIVLIIVAIAGATVIIQNSPEKVIEEMFIALKEGDSAKANKFVDYKKLMEGANLDTEKPTEVENLFFDKLEWKISNVKKDRDRATAEVEITNKDFKVIIADYTQEIVKKAFSGGDISEEEMQNYLIELLKKEDTQLATVTKTIEVIKQEDKWKVTVNEELITALLPGLEEAINSLNSISE